MLRGPQGTLYGRNSSAGAIRYITKDLTAKASLDLGATYGSYNNLNLQARIRAPILKDDKLDGSFSVIRHTRDGWMHDETTGRNVNDLDLTIIRGKLKSQLRLYLTPGHTPGTVSAIVPTRSGAKIIPLSLYGSVAFPTSLGPTDRAGGLLAYDQSVERFARISRDAGAQGILNTHIFADGTR